jgi:hypothetical protein
MHARKLSIALALVTASGAASAETLLNYGNDPFMHVSSRIAACPEPAGPRISEAEWRRDAHHRIEHGNHCWIEGRCRLPNAFLYDKEIAESLKRRLDTLSAALPAWRESSLWITVRGRWLTVQGCTGATFPKAQFLDGMREVPDVERVIDQTTPTPSRGVPYERYTPAPPRAASAPPGQP